MKYIILIGAVVIITLLIVKNKEWVKAQLKVLWNLIINKIKGTKPSA